MFQTGLGTKSLGKDAYDAPILIKRLFLEQALQHWRRYAAAVVLMGIAAGCTAIAAYLFGDVINQAYTNRNMTAIVALAGATVVLFAVKGLATYGHQVILTRIGVRIVTSNQRRMYEKLLNEGLGFFGAHHSSEFIARMTTGATSSAQVINILVSAVGRDLLSLIGLAAVMVIQDPLLSLVSIVVVPPALIVMRKLIRRMRNVATVQFKYYTQIIETMQETVQGIATVKAFTLEPHMRNRLEQTVAAAQHEAFKQARVANRASPLMESLGGIAIALAIIYCGYRVVVGGAQPGEFFSFMAAFLLAYEPAKRLTRLNLDIVANLVGVRVLFEIIDSPATEPLDDGKSDLRLSQARIEFSDVYFGYRPDEPVLRGVSFVAASSKLTALVGQSGGGKSTVFNLLLRFYELGRGTITIDGQNIADVSRRSLRSQIAYVGQNVQLFRGSVRDNIAIGRLGATEEEIVAAAKAAHAHDFIMAFPSGYDTPVGEHGLQLSGGQRQRIAIARALIKNAPIILLDEATAALDSESERHVQDAVAELCRGRTTLVIAHRLSTIMHADMILVVEGGRITEQGRHEELLRGGGRYASFYRLQLQDQRELAAPAAE
ncbi:MAG TPA: ABC transporter ATP-binding protein [Xanthobacteraceae bacterium]|nr:ABC transporter ATP-binding protein [Xanthobacteraceae bacterium]